MENRLAAISGPDREALTIRYVAFPTIPPARVTRRIIVNAVILWLGLRAMLAVFRLFVPAPRVAVLIVVVVGLLLRLDIKRGHEDILLGNLGVSWLGIWTVAAGPVALLEVVAGLVGRILLGPAA